jgi:hypothetical protein
MFAGRKSAAGTPLIGPHPPERVQVDLPHSLAAFPLRRDEQSAEQVAKCSYHFCGCTVGRFAPKNHLNVPAGKVMRTSAHLLSLPTCFFCFPPYGAIWQNLTLHLPCHVAIPFQKICQGCETGRRRTSLRQRFQWQPPSHPAPRTLGNGFAPATFAR